MPSFEPLRALIGAPLFTSIIVFRDGMGTWAFRNDEAEALGVRMLDLLRVPGHWNAYEEGVEHSIADLNEAIADMGPSTDAEQTPEELLASFQSLQESFTAFYKFGAFVEPVQIAVQSLLAPTIERLAGECTQSPASVTEALYSLDTSSYAVGHLMQLFEILAGIQGDVTIGAGGQTLSQVQLRPVDRFLDALRQVDENSSKALDMYVKERSWIKNDYSRCLELSTAEFVADDLASYGETLGEVKKVVRDQVAEIERTRADLQRRKSELIGRLTRTEAQMLSVHEAIGGRLLDTRKMMVKRSNARFSSILEQLAQHLGFEQRAMLQLLPQELPDVVRQPARYVDRLQARLESVLVYQADISVLDEDIYAWSTGFRSMDGPSLAEGDEAVGELLEVLGSRLDCLEASSLSKTDLEGVVVYSSPGTHLTEGLVEVVRDPKGIELKEGVILVTSSTTPEFLPLMRKAKAIVTDWGGQTSHAAIVSRELRIPCVIGTNYASYVFKSGDEIAIDWSTGRVSKRPSSGDSPT
jgi:phosphohistidine swiveling domain-containing protein